MSIAVTLKRLREKRNMTIREVAEKAGISSGNLGDIERGKTTAPRKKTLNKISDALNLTQNEKKELFESLVPEELKKIKGNNVKDKFIEENLKTKREKRQYEDFIKEASLMFNDEKISDEDKEKMFASLQEIFFTAKLLNKRKK